MVGLLRFSRVKELTGLSQSTVWRYEHAGNFPRRVQIGPNSVGWPAAEVDEWIKSRPRVESPSEKIERASVQHAVA